MNIAIVAACICGLCVGVIIGLLAAPEKVRLVTNYVPSKIVEPELRNPDVGFGEYMAIDWLRSRVSFRQPDGMTVVGHDMLVSAVNEVNRMHAELLTYRPARPGPMNAIIETDTAVFATSPVE